jgi:hypothetical protein
VGVNGRQTNGCRRGLTGQGVVDDYRLLDLVRLQGDLAFGAVVRDLVLCLVCVVVEVKRLRHHQCSVVVVPY